MRDNDFYKSYQTAEWQRKKNSVLERDDYTCQICGSSSGIMQVHHITYKHCHGKAYNAPMGDLITLCEYCHAHDDGDHVHFFNGDYRIDAGEEKPTVYGETEGYWDDPDLYLTRCPTFREYQPGTIISAKHRNYSWRHIGFFTIIDGNNAFFPYLLGLKHKDYMWAYDWHTSDDYTQIMPATREEVETFIHYVDIIWIKDLIEYTNKGVPYIDPNKFVEEIDEDYLEI